MLQKMHMEHIRFFVKFILDLKTSYQAMAHLPSRRVTPARPFANCGINFVETLDIEPKNAETYRALFVCLTSIQAITFGYGIQLEKRRLHHVNQAICFPKEYAIEDCDWYCKEFHWGKEWSETHQRKIKTSGYLLFWQRKESSGQHYRHEPPPPNGGIWEAALKLIRRRLRWVVGHQRLLHEELLSVFK